TPRSSANRRSPRASPDVPAAPVPRSSTKSPAASLHTPPAGRFHKVARLERFASTSSSYRRRGEAKTAPPRTPLPLGEGGGEAAGSVYLIPSTGRRPIVTKTAAEPNGP